MLPSWRPNTAEEHTTVSEKGSTQETSTHRELRGKLISKVQNVWILFVTIIFLKPEDGTRENQRSECRARVRHPGQLQILLIFPAGRKYSMTWMRGLDYRYFGRLQRRLHIFGGPEKKKNLGGMRLRVCVCYMFKFGLGRFSVPETQTRGLFLVMLRWCLSDRAIKQHTDAKHTQCWKPWSDKHQRNITKSKRLFYVWGTGSPPTPNLNI